MCCFIVVLPDTSYQVPRVQGPREFNLILQTSNLLSIRFPAGLPSTHPVNHGDVIPLGPFNAYGSSPTARPSTQMRPEKQEHFLP